MALRDYLNFPTRQELINFNNVLAHGQAVAVLGENSLGDIPQETWYFDENSMAVADNVTVIHPTVIPSTDPGRYHINMVQADWNAMFNKPELSTVATTGSYNDLEDKLTAGTGILMTNNEVSVDGNTFMSIAVANQEIATMQNSINGRVPNSRTLTINGVTQDLSGNRSWQVGNVSTDQSYANPAWITSLAYNKVTGAPTAKRQETYSGTSNSSGNYTVTFSTPYTVIPNIQASITNQANTNQFIRVSNVTTTGFTINVFQRSAVTLLGVEVLLAATTNVNGATIDVLVTEK